MRNAQLKQKAIQKAIQEAYGEHWETVKDFVNADGWIRDRDVDLISDTPMQFSTHDNAWYDTRRPLSLKGIESNMGWTRIEPDGSNLPAKSGKYHVVFKSGNTDIATYNDFYNKWMVTGAHYLSSTGDVNITHYRPIIEVPKPVY